MSPGTSGLGLPLAGITVVAVEQAVAVPFATRQLADLGARVIKVERPDGGDFARGYDETVKGLASYFVWTNRSKESLTLDLKHPEAKRILDGLLGEADVFIQNLAPGATARLGLGAEALRARWPSLIVCDLSGYGATGPYRDKKAYDLLVQCEAALLSVTGTPESPAKVGISVADIAAGMYAYTAVLTALFRRATTGEGASCEISLFDALTEWMSHPLYYTLYTAQPPKRTGTSHATVAPYGSFATGDGHTVQLGIQNEREWARFCADVLGRPEVAGDPRFLTNAGRVEHRDALTELIESVFAAVTASEVVARLDTAQIANALLNTVPDLIEHPQLQAADRWRDIDSPVGSLRALLPPVRMDGFEARMDPIPALGQHTDAILASLGYGADDIIRLRSDGAI
jgi:itaconate CoA-transferase